MADTIGQQDLSKRYPVSSDSGINADQYHEGREMNLVPEECSVVSSKIRETL